MTRQTLSLTDALHAYVVANGSEPDDLVRDLIAETAAALPHDAGMQVAPEQAALLTLLTRITGARHAVEIGTFTGLSSIAIARGLADGGRLVCFDVSEEFTSIARRYWRRAGLEDRDRAAASGRPRRPWRRCPPSRISIWRSSTRTRPATSATGRRSCPARGRAA